MIKMMPKRDRKPGRPRAIPEEWEPYVIALYRQGFGYRSIRHELWKEGISVHWSTVRRLVKKKLGAHLNCKPRYCFGGIVAKPKENLRPQPDYCFGGTGAKLNGNFHYKPHYHQGVIEVKQHENLHSELTEPNYCLGGTEVKKQEKPLPQLHWHVPLKEKEEPLPQLQWHVPLKEKEEPLPQLYWHVPLKEKMEKIINQE